eukprot:IDg2067t1
MRIGTVSSVAGVLSAACFIAMKEDGLLTLHILLAMLNAGLGVKHLIMMSTSDELNIVPFRLRCVAVRVLLA